MNRTAAAALALMLAAPARAEVPSVLGGKLVPAGTTAHHVAVGVPGLFYEWWNGGWDFDWAGHVGIVYEDWSGAWSDVDVGLELELPMRYRVAGTDAAQVALRIAPGLLVADAGSTVLGIRADAGALVSIDVHPRANLVTGGTVPFTILLVSGGDTGLILPVLGRLGLESFASNDFAVSLLLEVGPTFLLSDHGGNDSSRLGARFWVGATFYM